MEETTIGTRPRALIVDARDNVANLIGSARAGERVDCSVEAQEGTEAIALLDDIPANHKLARHDIPAGKPIIKYGLQIGTSTRHIERGRHVHAHNIESNRGRGDLKQ